MINWLRRDRTDEALATDPATDPDELIASLAALTPLSPSSLLRRLPAMLPSCFGLLNLSNVYDAYVDRDEVSLKSDARLISSRSSRFIESPPER